MKEIFIFVFEVSLLISSLNFIRAENLKYLNFPFKRNLTTGNTIKPEQFFNIYFYNQIYINISVGSEKQNIPFYLYLQQYPVVLQPSNAKNNEVKGIYDPLTSVSYKPLEKDEKKFSEGNSIRG